MPFLVRIHFLPSTIFDLDLESGSTTTIGQLKDVIRARDQAWKDANFTVVFRGKKLVDDQTLANAGIGAGEKIFVAATQPSTPSSQSHNQASAVPSSTSSAPSTTDAQGDTSPLEVTIFVAGKGKEVVSLPSGTNTTIDELKNIITQKYSDLDPDSQFLSASGKRLVSGATLKDYNVRPKQIIYVGRQNSATNTTNPSMNSDAIATSSTAAASFTSPYSTSSSRSKDDIVKDILENLKLLKQNTTRDEFVEAIQKFAKLLGNLVEHPDDPKFRRVRKENAALHKALFRHRGGVEAVIAIGFRESEEEPGSLFIRSPSPHLRAVQEMIQKAMRRQNIPFPDARSSAMSPGTMFGRVPFSSPASGDQMRSIMQNPMMQQMMSNPEMLQSMLPQVQQIMSNPDMMSQVLQEAQSNPMFANDPMLSSLLQDPQAMQQMASTASALQSNPQLLESMMGADPGFSNTNSSGQQNTESPSSLQSQEDAQLEEAILRSIREQSGERGDGNNNETANDEASHQKDEGQPDVD